jgi:hypothetical protein
MHNYKGDILVGATIRGTFNTRDTDAAPITLTSGTLRVYKDDGTTEDDSGITLNTDFDGRTGLHLWEVDTSADGTFYSAASDFFVVLTVGTVDAISVVGTCVGHFSIENRNIKANAVQFAGQTITAAAGVTLPTSVASPTNITAGTITTVTNLTNAPTAGDLTATMKTSVTTAATAATPVAASVTGNVGGNVTGSVGSVATGGITAASFAANAITAAKLDPDVTTELQAGLATAAALAVVDGIVDDILLDTAEIGTAGAGLTNINLPNQTMDIVGNITGNLSGSVGSVTGAVGSVTGAVGSVTGLTASDVGAIKAETDKLADTLEDDAGTYRFTTNALEQAPTGGSAPTAAAIADAVWDEVIAGHLTAGTTGASLNGAGSAGDPWTTSLPGAYGAGTAGKILGDNLNATVGSRATQTSVDTVDDLLDTELAAVKTDTAAIKLKTDNLPSDPADQSAVETAITAAQLTAAGVRSAVGLASANLDTQLADLPTNAELTTALGTADDAVLAQVALVKAKTDLIPSDPADQSAVEAAIDAAEAAILAAIPSIGDIEAAILDDANGVETSITPRQALRLILAASAGKLSGAATSTVIIRNVGDSKSRITATVDADGNRSAVTVDAT